MAGSTTGNQSNSRTVRSANSRTVKRSNSASISLNTSAPPPQSGDSLTSNGSLHPRRTTRRRVKQAPSSGYSSATIIKILLALVVVLALLDVHLLIKTTAPVYHHDSETSTSLEQAFHELHYGRDERPPIPEGEHDDVDFDKEPIYDILRQANINPDELDHETKRQLPTWSTIRRLYGDSPRIHGLDTCARFREITEPSLTFLATAGAFNSGTNLLAELMIQNCIIPERVAKYGEKQRGMRWQVKWGKHTPPRYREQHVTRTDKDVPIECTLPMITIRDPYNWMRSMCRHHYSAHWAHDALHCPHVWNEFTKKTSPVQVNYAEAAVYHDSLPAMWNDWYQEYLDVGFPRVFVRMEDLIFHGKNVTETLCQCGGGSPRRPYFTHVSKSAKLGTAAHGAQKTTLLEAIIRYGTDKDRFKGMTPRDIEVTKEILDPHLMEMFNYKNPE